LLRECLVSHNVNINDRKRLVSELLKSLDLPNDFVVDDVDINDISEVVQESKTTEISKDDIETPNNNANPNRRTSSRLGNSNSSSNSKDSNKKSKKVDEHNEFCDVCNSGGDLLCCDTCSLVFHISCIRPKVDQIPKGRWSCSYCIVDDLGNGDVKSARKAIKKMKLLSKGLDTDDDEPEKIKEVSIVKNGSKYVSRCITKKATNEIGRFGTLHDALISTEQFTKNPDGKKNDNVDDKDELWCTFCIDDPDITICAFCGCQICHGKHDSDYLIICDGCEAEIHTYCHFPQLTEIPSAEKWYCSRCLEETGSKKKKIKNDSSLPNTDSTDKLKLSTPKTENVPKSPSASSSKVDKPINYDVVGIDNALLLISRMTKGCTEKDKHFFEVFRQYCTYNDMVTVLKALEEQRDIIASMLPDSNNIGAIPTEVNNNDDGNNDVTNY